jgi:hypothetical protein
MDEGLKLQNKKRTPSPFHPQKSFQKARGRLKENSLQMDMLRMADVRPQKVG